MLKNRDITLPTKVCLVKARQSKLLVFPIVTYGCESWTIKKWTVVLQKTLESHLDRKEIKPVHSKESQSWIFIGRTDAEAPLLWPPDVKSWLTGKRPWCWERLKVGGEGDDRGGDSWMASPTWWTWVWISSRSWWWTGNPGCWPLFVHGVTKSQTQLSDWTELNWWWFPPYGRKWRRASWWKWKRRVKKLA